MRSRSATGRRTPTALFAVALATATSLLAGCSGTDTAPDGPSQAADSAPERTGSAPPGKPSSSRPAPAKPSSAPAGGPGTVAALGDSITRGFDACSALSDCPEVSWATGTDPRVDSFASRLGADRVWNLAATGAAMADLQGQVDKAVARKPGVITVLIGANDACRRTTAVMTPVEDFRRRFDTALRTVRTSLPGTRVVVGSVPDLERLWEIGRDSAEAKKLWNFGICPSMLARPDSAAETDRSRRAEVNARVDAYNSALEEVCATYDSCRFDAGAVHRHRFTARDLSPLDWFHPSVRGQSAIARILHGVYKKSFRDG